MPVLKSCIPCSDRVTARSVYFCILYPNGYRYYFNFVVGSDQGGGGISLITEDGWDYLVTEDGLAHLITEGDEQSFLPLESGLDSSSEDEGLPVLLDHPFDLYFPESVLVRRATGDDGVVLLIRVYSSFIPFKDLTLQISIPQTIYESITSAFQNPVDPTENQVNPTASELLSLLQFFLDTTPGGYPDLVPAVLPQTVGQVDFVLASITEDFQLKVDINHPYHRPPEDPVTVNTLHWRELLFTVLDVPSYDFYYISHGNLVMTFQDPRFLFLRHWIKWPEAWVAALKQFSGIQ